jgi:NTP pyrophosphatase (non-canonical NTP hydrolase)
MKLNDFQELMKELYFHRDSQRGVDKTFMWLTEEVGELGRAIRTENREGMEEEIADILAWLSSLANLLNIEMEKATLKKYGMGCPRCNSNPCRCTF